MSGHRSPSAREVPELLKRARNDLDVLSGDVTLSGESLCGNIAETLDAAIRALAAPQQPTPEREALALLREAQDTLAPYMQRIPGTGEPGILNAAAQLHDRIEDYLACLAVPHKPTLERKALVARVLSSGRLSGLSPEEQDKLGARHASNSTWLTAPADAGGEG